jgi:4-amino-4-deoxy-L-arabinose transferase-like glycosyltransferase
MGLNLLLLLIFALRVWNLPGVPPGITHDEASNGHDSAAILKGHHRIYFPVGYGHEPLYNYSVAALTIFLGQGIFTLRFTTVIWGLLQSSLTIALARRWWGRPAAIAVAAAYAANFWSLMSARVGLRAPTLPALLAASVLCYHRAIQPGASNDRDKVAAAINYGAAGLFLGASLYTYMASRGMPLLYVTFLIALAFLKPSRARAIWRGTLAVLLIALSLSAPLFVHLHRNPHLEQRIGQLGSAITALTQGDAGPLLTNIRDNVPLLIVQGDPQWLYNVAGRPGLEPLLALAFIVGTLLAVRHWRNERYLLTGIWLIGGLAPALLVSVDYNLLHAIAAMPPVMLLIGAGAAWSARRLTPSAQPGRLVRLRRGARIALIIAGLGGFAVTTARTAHAYFITWAENRNVRVAYHHHVVALARHLEDQPHRPPTVITTLYPGEVHDPYAMEVTLGQRAWTDRRHNLRWADGRTALFIPAAQGHLFVESQTQPRPPLWELIAPDLTPLVTLSFRESDIPSQIFGYAWDGCTTWQRLMERTRHIVAIGSGDPAPGPGSGNTFVELPIRFGDPAALTDTATATGEPVVVTGVPVVATGEPVVVTGVTLMGHLQATGPAADGTNRHIQLLTVWEVNAATRRDLTIFAHLLDTDGALIDQDDRLDAPSWQWQPGDRWIQLHEFVPTDDVAERAAYLALGLYDSDTGDRLTVTHVGREAVMWAAAIPPQTQSSPGATRVIIPLESSQP